MKFVCDRGRLNDGLQKVVGVVDPRHVKELLQSVKVEARKDSVILSGTDLEVGMRIALGGVAVEQPGQMVLPAVRLASIVRESNDEMMGFAAEEGVCVIEGKDSRYRVLGQVTDEFPDIPAFPEGDALEIEGAVIREMIHKTSFAAAPEKMRYALNGVFLVLKENSNKVEMVATDGRRLAWVQRKANKKSPLAGEAIIPTKGALQLERMVGDAEAVRIALTERNIFACTAEAELVAQLVDGKFPSFRDVIPKDMETKIDIASDVLLSAVRRAALLADRDDDQSRGVRLLLGEGAIRVTSQSARSGEAAVEVPVEYSGAALELSINPDYLIDGLKGLGGGVVRLELRDSVTPCIFRQGADYLYLAMPIT